MCLYLFLSFAVALTMAVSLAVVAPDTEDVTGVATAVAIVTIANVHISIVCIQ